MLYTSEGNLRAEDKHLRLIARKKVRAALDRLDTDTAALVNALVEKVAANGSCRLSADELLEMVNSHPRLLPERTTIDRYTDAFPELREAALSTCGRINTHARRRIEAALAPFETARRFAYTRGLNRC